MERIADTRDQNRPISWRRLPVGDYFYHYSQFRCLDSLKPLGLVTPVVHKERKNYQDLEFYSRDDCIFFVCELKDCIGKVRDSNYPE